MFTEFIRNFFAGLLFLLACLIPTWLVSVLPSIFVRDKMFAFTVSIIVVSSIVSIIATIIYNIKMFAESGCYDEDYFEDESECGDSVSVHCANALLIPNILVVIIGIIIYSVAMIMRSSNSNIFEENNLLFICTLISGFIVPNQFCFIVFRFVGYASCACGECHKMCTWKIIDSVNREFSYITHESNTYKTGEISLGDSAPISVYTKVYSEKQHNSSYNIYKCYCRHCGRKTERVGGLYEFGNIDKCERNKTEKYKAPVVDNDFYFDFSADSDYNPYDDYNS